ncbi:MAG: sodium:proton antiporter [Actinobacteria bacterium]|nr:sodium:proton antiporter [Actinomycetota bacterium]
MAGPTAGTPDGRHESADQRADRNWTDLLQELRVTQTGTQIIGGFLLTLPFQQRFTELSATQVAIYLGLVALTAVATALGLAVVALHRAHFRHHEKPRLVEVADRLLALAVVSVAALSTGVVVLVFDVVVGRVQGLVAGALTAAIVSALLALVPMAVGAPRIAGGRRR